MSDTDPDPGLGARSWARRVIEHRLVQPDRFSCGASTLVLLRAVTDEAYAEALATGAHPRTGHRFAGSAVPDRFAAEALAMHRRVTGPVDLRGRLQPPWPRALGTPPWAVARQLGSGHRVRPVAPWARERAYAEILAGLERGQVVLYVGNRLLPRHVVAVLAGSESALSVYDPGVGAVSRVPRADFVTGRLRLSGWSTPWFTVRG